VADTNATKPAVKNHHHIDYTTTPTMTDVITSGFHAACFLRC